MKGLASVIWTIAVILFVIWLIGLIAQMTFGGLIHLLLVLIVVAVVFNLLTGRS